MRAPRPSACAICRSSDRAAIELAIARNVAFRTIQRRFGVHKDAVYRHRQRHLPESLRRALRVKSLMSEADLSTLRIEESRGLLERLVHQRADLYQMIESAKEVGDLGAANSIHKTLQRNLELTARLLGQFIQEDRVVVNNLTVSPQYVELRAALLRALFHHPAAREAVLAELRALETKSPVTIDVPFVEPLAEGLNGQPE